MTQPLDLNAIETRAAHLHEYGTLDDEPLQADLDELTGTDVPALVAEIRRLRRQRKYLIDQLAKRDAETGRGDAALREFLAAEPTVETHVVADDSDNPEHVDDCPGCEDTLPAWLYQRFMPDGVGWDHLDADDRAYWEHHARAVRRAVTRGGFKAPATPAP